MEANHKGIKIGENCIMWKKFKSRKVHEEVLAIGKDKQGHSNNGRF